MESTQSQRRVISLAGVAGIFRAVGGAGWLVVGLPSEVVIQPTGAGHSVSEIFWITIQVLLFLVRFRAGSTRLRLVSPFPEGWISLRRSSTPLKSARSPFCFPSRRWLRPLA